jgi:hypothetical protein
MKKVIFAAIIALAFAAANAQFFPGFPGGQYGSFPFMGNTGFPTIADSFGFNDIDTTFRTRNYGRGYGYSDPYAQTYGNPNVYGGYPYSYNAVPYGYGAPVYGAPVAPVYAPAAPAAQ